MFRDGGRLMYLGGNGLNCAVEIGADDTMVVRNGAIRGLWPEQVGAASRFALFHESEAHLLGVVFTPAGMMTAAPYRVLGAGHWAFAGTGLRDGDTFGRYGIEIDARSPASPPGTQVLARIPDVIGPGRSAEMTYYETPAGAKVFAAGALDFGGSATTWPVRRMLENLWDHLGPQIREPVDASRPDPCG